MMDEIDRLKTFPEPPEKEEQEENQIQVKQCCGLTAESF